MAARLPIWLFLAIALILMGFGLYPMLRYLLKIDSTISMPFATVIMLLIGGLMCGLTAMMLLVRRQPMQIHYQQNQQPKQNIITQMHACGLLLYSGIPLANFLAAYVLWRKHRGQSKLIDQQGITLLNFQISIYLYLLLALFLVIAYIGFFLVPLVLLVHLIATLLAIIYSLMKKPFRYPANIAIIK